MRRLALICMTAVTLLCSTPGIADRDHGRHYYRYHERGYYPARYVEYRPAPRYWVRAAPARYYYEEPRAHYHYYDGRYEPHHGYCDHAFLWIGGAMVLSDLIYHAHH